MDQARCESTLEHLAVYICALIRCEIRRRNAVSSQAPTIRNGCTCIHMAKWVWHEFSKPTQPRFGCQKKKFDFISLKGKIHRWRRNLEIYTVVATIVCACVIESSDVAQFSTCEKIKFKPN